MSPEHVVTGSIHSYISSSDDECGARIITLPVFSVTQSITDIHNTCVSAYYMICMNTHLHTQSQILEWDPDCCAEEESKELTTVHST